MMIGGMSAKISVLVVWGKPLGFDLLLGIYAIKALGGMVVGPTGSVQLGNKEIVKCAAISLNEPDLTATFNHQSWAWTVAWKWSEGHAPEALDNRVTEYPEAAEILEDYERELRTWMNNGWLVPYKEEKLGPPKGWSLWWPYCSSINEKYVQWWTFGCSTVMLMFSQPTQMSAQLNCVNGGKRVPMYLPWTLREHIFRCVSRWHCSRSRPWRFAGRDTAWHI